MTRLRVGCIHNFNLKDGGNIRERLLTLSDSTSPHLLILDRRWAQNYTPPSSSPITGGDRSFIEWSAEFDCAPERERPLADLVGNGVFQGGFDALKRQVTRR